jgi:hypothetical protein
LCLWQARFQDRCWQIPLKKSAAIELDRSAIVLSGG